MLNAEVYININKDLGTEVRTMDINAVVEDFGRSRKRGDEEDEEEMTV
jgi:hypothetical protein